MRSVFGNCIIYTALELVFVMLDLGSTVCSPRLSPGLYSTWHDASMLIVGNANVVGTVQLHWSVRSSPSSVAAIKFT